MRQLVLNDVSVSDARFETREGIRAAIQTLVEVAATLVQDQLAIAVLRSVQPLEEVVFRNHALDQVHYGFGDFYRDRGVDADARVFLLSLSIKVPLLDSSPEIDETVRDAFYRMDFFVGSLLGPKSAALGLAFLIQGIGVSVNSMPIWNASELTLLPLILDDEGLIEGPTATISHAASLPHCAEIAQRVADRRREELKDGAELWGSLGELFPCLRFSPDVQENLERLPRELIRFVVSRLSKMEESARAWREGEEPFPPEYFTIKDEGEATLQRYSEERTFRLPEGGRAVFSLHTPISGRHRIHFLADHVARTFVIGYVGDHLPTVRFN